MDMISRLPNAVLYEILKLLSSKEAASTSTLSKRWEHLFKEIPVVDLAWEASEYLPKNRKDNLSLFYSFVDNVVSFPRQLRKFSIYCDNPSPIDMARLNQWMLRVSAPGKVEDFALTISGHDQPLVLPLELHSLLKLKLGKRFRLKLSTDATFPLLDSVDLDSITFAGNEDGLKSLLTKSPILQELVINGLEWDQWKTSTLASPTLRRVTVHCFTRRNHRRKTVSFDIPQAEFLDYTDSVAFKYGPLNFNSLLSARINLISHDDIICNPTPLINAIAHVETLFVSSSTSKLLDGHFKGVPKFQNLHYLTMDVDKFSHWSSLRFFLDASPNLHTLVIKGEGYQCVYENRFTTTDLRQSDLELCLRNSQIRALHLFPDLHDRAFKKVVEMTTFFLGHLSSLEQVIVHYKTRKDDTLEEMMKKPRLSPNCRFQMLLV